MGVKANRQSPAMVVSEVWKGGSPSSAWGMGVTSQVSGRDRFPSCSPVGASTGPSLPETGLRLTGADVCLDPYDLELGLENRATMEVHPEWSHPRTGD